MRRAFLVASLLLAPSLLIGQSAVRTPYKPTRAELAANYQRAERWVQEAQQRMFLLTLSPNWLEGGKRFWYRAARKDGSEFMLVDSETGRKQPAFDHARVAEALGKALGRTLDAKRLPVETIAFREGKVVLTVERTEWLVDPATYEITRIGSVAPPQRPPNRPWRQYMNPPDLRPVPSPDGSKTVRIVENSVVMKAGDGPEVKLVEFGANEPYVARIVWTPDSKRLVLNRVAPGDRNMVYLLESSGPGMSSVLHQRVYDQPGDKVDTVQHWIVDVEAKTAKPTDADIIDYGGQPALRWIEGTSRFRYEKMDRGYGRWRLIEVDASTGASRTIIDEDPPTFYDSTAHLIRYLDSGDIVFSSERSGWRQLYRIDGETGQMKNPITTGEWVVRGIEFIDEKSGFLVLRGSGKEPGQDPYYIHYYRVNLDGSGLQRLTDGDGNHEATFSPDRQYFVDSWSRVDKAPVHELRRTRDGALVATLETADISRLSEIGWQMPERFVAKGRDGRTDIYGILIRPSKLDTRLSYPVVEDIYAGPHDSFVPKSFRGFLTLQSLAELGFVVVKVDGMGTRNRSKAFHDVAYKNIADAGFPDRILWMKAAAAKYPCMDVSRVGIYGTSAGGQSSTGALLFHPEFYKVAVSSCGCHDNRMDKIWWNEQWMGPIGPHYAEQSNITNAHKLQGRLMLIVGELDDNVPPESTYRLADALIKAGKDFDFLMIPSAGHTSGGSYGERRRRDFFVRHLLGVEPPERNATTATRTAQPAQR